MVRRDAVGNTKKMPSSGDVGQLRDETTAHEDQTIRLGEEVQCLDPFEEHSGRSRARGPRRSLPPDETTLSAELHSVELIARSSGRHGRHGTHRAPTATHLPFVISAATHYSTFAANRSLS